MHCLGTEKFKKKILKLEIYIHKIPHNHKEHKYIFPNFFYPQTVQKNYKQIIKSKLHKKIQTIPKILEKFTQILKIMLNLGKLLE